MKFLDGQLHEGNCLEIMPDIPDDGVDMVLCDLRLTYHTVNGITLT